MKKASSKRTLPLLGAGILAAGILTAAGLPGEEAAYTGSPAVSAAYSPAAAATQPVVPDSRAAEAKAGIRTDKQEAAFVQLQQVRFLTATTGWMIRSDSAPSGKQTLRLVVTQDGMRSLTEHKLPGDYAAGIGLSDAQTGWVLVYEAPRKTSGTVSGYSRARLLHTRDGGKTWKTQWSKTGSYPASSQRENAVTVVGPRSAYAIIGPDLLVTRDGRSWSKAAFGRQDFVPTQVSFANARNGWAAGTMPPHEDDSDARVVSVLHTSDGGRIWSKQLTVGPTNENSDSSQLRSAALDFVDAKTGFLLTDDPSTMTGVLYRTTNGGASWRMVNGGLRSHRPLITGMDFADGQAGWLYASPGAGPVEGGLMITRDGGKTFAHEPDAGYDLSFAQYFKSGSGYAAGRTFEGEDYLTRTRDGGETWTPVYRPYSVPGRSAE
ncbi:WD40/YVTN/BNR-like repeat-containing protein [Saccharibacillus deserti]|uniref:WD40/YVTN/BNR-like repeat-containing protein n=1 Tax=Saccharibacillus deserti TaxID=1634444 RepID=UPI001558170A|nr:hypothetical protein [Saccharibacillus deserti]